MTIFGGAGAEAPEQAPTGGQESESGAPEQEQGSQEAVEETQTEGEPSREQETDWQAEAKRLQDEVDRKERVIEGLRQRRRSRSGGDNNQIAGLQSEVRGLKRELRRDRARQMEDEGQQRQMLQQLDEEERQEQHKLQVDTYKDQVENDLAALLAEHGLEPNDPAIQRYNRRWQRAQTQNDVDDIFDRIEEDLRNRSSRQEGQRNGQQQSNNNQNGQRRQRDMAMSVPQGGAGASESEQVWLNRWADETDTSIPGTPANSKKAQELMDKGLRPHPRRQT